MKKLSRVLWGVLLVAVGVVLALRSIGVQIDIFFDGWWTLFIIVPCLIGLFKNHDKTGNLIGIAVGICLFLACRDILSFELLWKTVVPVVIIVVGLKLIFGGLLDRKGETIKEELEQEGKTPPAKCAVFSGQNCSYNGEYFYGAGLTAVFGGVECDLREAVIERDCVIDVCAVFGGIDIFLPENVNVKINSTSIFGGMEDKRKKNKEENAVTVYVRGIALFGGVDIK